jgi:hypothetical protein
METPALSARKLKFLGLDTSSILPDNQRKRKRNVEDEVSEIYTVKFNLCSRGCRLYVVGLSVPVRVLAKRVHKLFCKKVCMSQVGCHAHPKIYSNLRAHLHLRHLREITRLISFL